MAPSGSPQPPTRAHSAQAHCWLWPPGHGACDADSECPSPYWALLESRALTPTALWALSGQPQHGSTPGTSPLLVQHLWAPREYLPPSRLWSQPLQCCLNSSLGEGFLPSLPFHGCCSSALEYYLELLCLFIVTPLLELIHLYIKLPKCNLPCDFCLPIGPWLTEESRRCGWGPGGGGWGCMLKAGEGELDQERTGTTAASFLFHLMISESEEREKQREGERERANWGGHKHDHGDLFLQAVQLPIPTPVSPAKWPGPAGPAWEPHGDVFENDES